MWITIWWCAKALIHFPECICKMGDKMLRPFRAEGGLNVNAPFPLNNNTLSSTYAKFNNLQRISSTKTQEVAFAELCPLTYSEVASEAI